MNMQPWASTLTAHQTRRAGKTVEEAGELIAVLGRIQIQAIDDIDIGSGKTNRVRLMEETADLIAQCELNIESFGLNVERLRARIELKKHQMADWESHFHGGQ